MKFTKDLQLFDRTLRIRFSGSFSVFEEDFFDRGWPWSPMDSGGDRPADFIIEFSEADLEEAPCRLRVSRERWTLDGPTGRGWFDLAEKRGVAVARRAGPRDVSADPDAVRCTGRIFADTFVRLLLCAWVREKGGIVVHAAGLVVDKRAYVFPGCSGAGKSTLARQLPDFDLLSDEYIFIVPGAGGPQVVPSPPFGHAQRLGPVHVPVPLAGVYRIEREAHVGFRPVRRSVALARLLCVQSGWPGMTGELKRIDSLLSSVELGAFSFTPGLPLSGLILSHCRGRHQGAAVSLFRREIEKGSSLWLKVSGKSMYPLCRPGDHVLVRGLAGESLSPGELVVFQSGHGFVVHRYLGKHWRDRRFLSAGDACPDFDLPWDDSRLVGRVVALRRKGRVVSLLGDRTARFRAVSRRFNLALRRMASWMRGAR